jgi:hypothetical protein
MDHIATTFVVGPPARSTSIGYANSYSIRLMGARILENAAVDGSAALRGL